MTDHNEDEGYNPFTGMSTVYDDRTTTDLADEINIEIQSLATNFEGSLSGVRFLLLLMLILEIIAIVHFW